MSMSAAEIEAIVRVVLQRVRALPRGADGSSAQNASLPLMSAGQQSTCDANDLKILDQVVSLDCVAGRLEGIATLRVPAKAVITPAVHDELRSRKIQLQRLQPLAANSTKSRGHSSELLCVAQAEWQSVLLPSVEFITATSNCSADTGRVAAHINSGGTAAIWCSKTPFAALRAASKNPALVPVQLHRVQDFDRAHQEATPNLIILDSETWDSNRTLQLAEQWKGRLP